ncbi:unnamed protein product [Moneuplotes crassus]|uniref:START domain-containing protein n=1 Tax=Euplotes crassus TaxID=5936 RepID=A0AAD1UTU1_EUPCR|nr:unnamed protein product [Moneuplotes crassus]
MGNTCTCDPKNDQQETKVTRRRDVKDKSQKHKKKVKSGKGIPSYTDNFTLESNEESPKTAKSGRKSSQSSKKKRKKCKNRGSKQKSVLKDSSLQVISSNSHEDSNKVSTVQTTQNTLTGQPDFEIAENLENLSEIDEGLDANELALDGTESKKYTKTAYEKAEIMHAWITDKVWKKNKTKKGVTLMTAKGDNGGFANYQTTVINAPMDRCVELIQDFDNHYKANQKLEEVKVLEELDGPDGKYIQNALVQARYMKGNFVIKAREFILYKGLISPKNDERIIVIYSVEHPDAPRNKKKIRGEYEGMYWFKKISEDQTELQIVSEFKLGGSIPNIVINMVQGQNIEETIYFKKIMESA